MDAHLTSPRINRALAGLALGASCCLASVAADISDPTQPPAPLRAQGANRGIEAAPAEPLRLQMIIRGPGEARVAIVDGRVLRAGDKVAIDGGSAQVMRITETTLVVRHADRRIESIELAGVAHAVRCTRVVGDTALPCAPEPASGLEKTR